MTPRAAIALLVLAAASPQIGYFRYLRPIANVPQSGQTCIALDPAVFARSASGLADLRLYNGSTETPYSIYTAAPAEGAEKTITPLNLGSRGGHAVFDAAVPEGSYSDVQLAITGHDFLATVNVSGSQSESATAATQIGSYTIFDLSHQKLGRSTVLHLPVSDFRYLHFRIQGPILPENITGLNVGRMPAGKPRYVVVAEEKTIKTAGHQSIVEFTVPDRVPVDRIIFAPGAAPKNFSRDVHVEVKAQQPTPPPGEEIAPPSAATSGSLLRIHTLREAQRIEEERLELDAPQTAYFNAPSRWKITIDNGDDRPIDIQSIRLEMIERSICFDAAPSAAFTLYFGDPALSPPQYDYARLFAHQPNAAQATLGPEQPNPTYSARPDQRPFTERHPALLWIALIAVVALLGAIALRSAKRIQPTS